MRVNCLFDDSSEHLKRVVCLDLIVSGQGAVAHNVAMERCCTLSERVGLFGHEGCSLGVVAIVDVYPIRASLSIYQWLGRIPYQS